VESTGRTHRLFFALWPGDDVRKRLAREARRFVDGPQAKAIPADNFHITLAFLGPVEARKLSGVLAAASRVEAAPFSLNVGRIEAWADARILCFTPEPSQPLHALADRLRFNLFTDGLQPDRKEFRPHITVAREWSQSEVAGSIGPFEWTAHEFVLVESESSREGSHYRIIDRWALAGESRQ
jgi:RNA 2',3'-cyclic 3'-phosphodiesterase